MKLVTSTYGNPQSIHQYTNHCLVQFTTRSPIFFKHWPLDWNYFNFSYIPINVNMNYWVYSVIYFNK